MREENGGRSVELRAPRHIVNSHDHHDHGRAPNASQLARPCTDSLEASATQLAHRELEPVGAILPRALDGLLGQSMDPQLWWERSRGGFRADPSTVAELRALDIDPDGAEGSGVLRLLSPDEPPRRVWCSPVCSAIDGRRVGGIVVSDLRRPARVLGERGVMLSRRAWRDVFVGGHGVVAIVTTSHLGFVRWCARQPEVACFGLLGPEDPLPWVRRALGRFRHLAVRVADGHEARALAGQLVDHYGSRVHTVREEVTRGE